MSNRREWKDRLKIRHDRSSRIESRRNAVDDRSLQRRLARQLGFCALHARRIQFDRRRAQLRHAAGMYTMVVELDGKPQVLRRRAAQSARDHRRSRRASVALWSPEAHFADSQPQIPERRGSLCSASRKELQSSATGGAIYFWRSSRRCAGAGKRVVEHARSRLGAGGQLGHAPADRNAPAARSTRSTASTRSAYRRSAARQEDAKP